MKHKPLKELARKLGILTENKSLIEGFCFDSRLVQKGEVFFALKGEKVDGHSFLKEVAHKGAIAAVVSSEYAGEDFGLLLLPVKDVIWTLQKLAKEELFTRKTKIIGVTGSVGKTTTKEFIATLLQNKFKLAKSPGSANSQVSLPLVILNAQGDEEMFVLEMGMSQKGELKTLTDIAPPDIAVVTRIALAHAAFFEGIEEIAEAKAEILSQPKTALCIIGEEAYSFAPFQKAPCKKILYSCSQQSQAESVLYKKGEQFVVLEQGNPTPLFSLPFQAMHLAENFLAAATVARSLGMSWEEIIVAAKHLAPFEKRFQQIDKEGIIFINDSYNASPTSVRAALQNLPAPKQGKKRIAALGDMRELGKFSEVSHREIGQFAKEHVEHLLCYGQESLAMAEEFRKGGKIAEHYSDIDAMRKRLFSLAEVGDVVLIKASKSLALWRLLEVIPNVIQESVFPSLASSDLK